MSEAGSPTMSSRFNMGLSRSVSAGASADSSSFVKLARALIFAGFAEIPKFGGDRT